MFKTWFFRERSIIKEQQITKIPLTVQFSDKFFQRKYFMEVSNETELFKGYQYQQSVVSNKKTVGGRKLWEKINLKHRFSENVKEHILLCSKGW